MRKLITLLDRANHRVGRAVMWLAVAMAVIQFATVVLRYVFAVGFIPVQESIWYLNGVLFMLGAGFTLMTDGHVRVDIFYREASDRRRALTDFLGSMVLLIPVCLAVLVFSWRYVIGSWRVLEGSTEVSGLPFVFLLKTVIWAFAVLLLMQAVALALRAWLMLSGASAGYSAAAERAVRKGGASPP